MILSKKLSKN